MKSSKNDLVLASTFLAALVASSIALAADQAPSAHGKKKTPSKPNEIEQTAPTDAGTTIESMQAPDAAAGSEGRLSPGAGSQAAVGIKFNIGGKAKKTPTPDPIPAPKGKPKAAEESEE